MALRDLCIRHFTAIGAVLLAGAAGVFTAGSAHAQFGVCRGDPIIQLSNGHTIEVSVVVAGDPTMLAAIQGIRYEVHVPANVTPLSTDVTNSPLASLQMVNVIPDPNNGPNEYWTAVTVSAPGFTPPILLTQTVVNLSTNQSAVDTASTAPTQSLGVTVDEPSAP